MELRFQAGGANRWKAEVTLTFAFKGQTWEGACQELAAGAPWLGIAPGWRDFKGKKEEAALLYGPPAMDLPRVLVIGLGEPDKLELVDLRNAIGTAARRCREGGFGSLGLDLPSLGRVAAALGSDLACLTREAVIAFFMGLYRYERFLTDKSDLPENPAWLALMSADEHFLEDIKGAARLAEAEAAGLTLARDLANGPANLVTPTFFAQTAQAVAGRHGMRCAVLDVGGLERENMGALLGVARGAAQEPRMVIMEYHPKGAKGANGANGAKGAKGAKAAQDAEGQKPLVLVGKGITFDSGGISLKPAAGMEEMKGDMSGAAAVLGVFEALGQMSSTRQPSRPIIGLMPCTENMPDGNALHPGDILLSRSGISIEVTNTDAEGRLILADALSYAQDHWEAEAIIDIATLTGACMVALGKDSAGLFCANEHLCDKIFTLGNSLGERFWPLPLWSTSKKLLKSNVADLANVGPREGGAIHAAVFLQQFIKSGQVWAHLDIAATDHTESPTNAKGASGFGVRTLLELCW